MDIDSLNKAVAKAVAAGATSVPVAAPTITGSVLLIDGDGFNYSCAGNDDTSPQWARTRLMQRIKGLIDNTGAETVIMELSQPGGNKRHRNAIATVKPYQGQRKNHKPKNWEHLRSVLEEANELWETAVWADREADDGIAYHASKYISQGRRVFIASADKDMRMLPGIHVNLETYEQIVVQEEELNVVGSNGKQFGRLWFYLQMLHGDAVDNIPGLPRVLSTSGKMILCGEVTAERVLGDPLRILDAFTTTCVAYKEYYGEQWTDAMVEQAALLWLSREADASDWCPPEMAESKLFAGAIQRLKERVLDGTTKDN